LKITLAHSPDADDAFMFYPLLQGKIDTGGLEFQEILEDIETLNRKAEAGEYDVTAISFHSYPEIQDHYLLLSTGACFGENYGPVLVSSRFLKPRQVLKLRAAIPGKRTTAFLVLKLWERAVSGGERSGISYTEVPFDQVMDRVLDKKMDLGLVIHEGQLTYQERGLQKVVDLGEWWHKQTVLPLPLGAIAVRRNLDWEMQKRIATVIRESIQYALGHKEESLVVALPYARGLDAERAARFIEMYVNPMTVDWGRKGLRAVRALFERGYQYGLLDSKVDLESAILDFKSSPVQVAQEVPPPSEPPSDLPQDPNADDPPPDTKESTA